jgi:hypothetical protein
MYRVLPLLLVAVALAMFIGVPALAQQKDKDTETHEGKVVSASGNKLVMTDKADKQHTHTLAPTAQITCDGKQCKLEDLKPGMRIRVTTAKGDIKTATKVEALDKEKDFPKGGGQ